MSYCDYCGYSYMLTECACGVKERICMCGFDHECGYLLGEIPYPDEEEDE